jgi:hypothetical protein
MTEMIPSLPLVLFEYLNMLVALFAIGLAIKWQKMEFVAGLFFLLLYTLIDAIELSLSAIFEVSLINASQYGFVLLALLAFILSMRPGGVIQRPS